MIYLKVKKSKGHSKTIKSDGFDVSYRQFCINDEKRNLLQFSMKYVTENIDEFMKSIGAKDDYDITQYDFTEDGCIIVDHDALKENTFVDLPKNIVDLPVSDNIIKYDTKGVSYDPLSNVNKGKVAGIVIGSFLAVAVIAIDIRKKKNNENSNEQNVEQPVMDNNEGI